MAPKFAFHNKGKLGQVEECACYHCLKVFKPAEIVEWTDKEKDTAICPHCSVDAVIPIYEDKEKDTAFLTQINKYWF